METKFKIPANWNELKSKLTKNYPDLTEDDLVYSIGKEDELLTHLSKKLGKNKKEICNIIDNVLSTNTPPTSNLGSTIKKNKVTEYHEKYEEDIERERDEEIQSESQEEISRGY